MPQQQCFSFWILACWRTLSGAASRFPTTHWAWDQTLYFLQVELSYLVFMPCIIMPCLPNLRQMSHALEIISLLAGWGGLACHLPSHSLKTAAGLACLPRTHMPAFPASSFPCDMNKQTQHISLGCCRGHPTREDRNFSRRKEGRNNLKASPPSLLPALTGEGWQAWLPLSDQWKT